MSRGKKSWNFEWVKEKMLRNHSSWRDFFRVPLKNVWKRNDWYSQPTILLDNSLFQALGQWGRSKNQAGDERGLDPARRPPAIWIVSTDWLSLEHSILITGMEKQNISIAKLLPWGSCMFSSVIGYISPESCGKLKNGNQKSWTRKNTNFFIDSSQNTVTCSCWSWQAFHMAREHTEGNKNS